MRLILVRHGHPNYKDDCLTELGKKQAEAVAARLREEPIAEVYASTCGRALETGQYIADVFGLCPIPLSFMREIRWGSIDGSELSHKGHPWDTADDAPANGFDLMDPNWQTGAMFSNNNVSKSVAAVIQAFDAWLSTLGYFRDGAYYRAATPTDKTIVLASHAGSSCAVLSHLFNLPFPFVCGSLRLDFTSVTIVDFHGKQDTVFQPRIELLNDFRHIRGITVENIIDR